jgi:DNA-binding XRE family transcriptional regulator
MQQFEHESIAELAATVGRHIRWARELVVPNRNMFAQRMGVDSSTIKHIEAGKRLPSLPLFMQLCQELKISPQYILQGQLAGVDGELAVLLASHHPELKTSPRMPLHPTSLGTRRKGLRAHSTRQDIQAA